MQDPIAVQIVNAVQYLVQQALDHPFRHHNRLFGRLCSAMEFDYVPQIVFGIVEEQPNLPICMGQKYPDEVDHVGMFQLSE